jgi:5-methylcytosine-specific restriction endonuclease McrA
MGMIIRVAFNNRSWNGKCINADKRDRRLYKCWGKVVETGYKIDNKGKCKAECIESSLCKSFKWYNFLGDFDSSRAKGKVYFVYPDIGNSLVLWGKSKINTVKGDTITFEQFKPMAETKWLRNLIAKDILGEHWKSNPFRYIEKDIEQLLDKLIENSDKTFNDVAELDISSEEGKEKLKKHLIKERSANLIITFKKSLNSYECNVCGFDFEKEYGALGKGFIEAHHIKPIHTLQGSTKVSIANLLAVCSNCHRMIHRTKEMTDWKVLKKLLTKNA